MDFKTKIIEKGSSTEYKMTEGESFIRDYLNEKKIKFQPQKNLGKLKGDNKAYRIADFYLTDYHTVIEFQGQWNKNDDAMLRYNQKKQLYHSNDIPCIYLYPENLGILDYVYNIRLTDELKKHNLTNELLRHRIRRLIKDRGDLFFWLSLAILLLFTIDYKTNPENNYQIYISLGSIIFFQLFRLTRGYIKFFVNG